MLQGLQQSADSDTVIFMDSGGYEKFWKGDKSWSQDKFHKVLQMYPHNLCLSYDNDLHPIGSVRKIVQDIETSVLQHQQHTSAPVVPIVHCQAEESSEMLPEILRMVAEKMHPTLISIPERDLGVSFLNRIETMRKIRSALDELGLYYPLHLLGVAHPLSLIAYAIAGADSFDGLEWCRAAVDPASGRLFNFYQGDLFQDQRNLGEGVRSAFDYHCSIIKANLIFYIRLMKKVRKAVHSGHEQDLLEQYAPGKSAANLILGRIRKAL